MTSSCATTKFQDDGECVSWRGQSFSANGSFTSFLQIDVRSRLDGGKQSDDFSSLLSGLDLTGMGKKTLENVLSASNPVAPHWVGGEALAEAYLIETEGVIFPWDRSLDKLNPLDSLPGPDIIGFVPYNGGHRLALGEVKASSEDAAPPRVMSSRPGCMGHQLDELTQNVTKVVPLLKWLHARVSGGPHQAAFECSCSNYFNSGRKSVTLFGILVRDTKPDERDVSALGKALRQTLSRPTRCDLIALYLPWKLRQLVPSIRGGIP